MDFIAKLMPSFLRNKESGSLAVSAGPPPPPASVELHVARSKSASGPSRFARETDTRSGS